MRDKDELELVDVIAEFQRPIPGLIGREGGVFLGMVLLEDSVFRSRLVVS